VDLEDKVDIFVKDTRFVSYGEKDDWEEWQGFFKNELETFEKLRWKTPCPNIAVYLGCAVMDVRDAESSDEDVRIISVVMDKYECTLADRCAAKAPPLDVDMCMAQVDAALAHLHLMDLYHNDVRTDSIMLKDDDTAELIDFDSCLPMDATLLKGTIAGGHITKNKSGPENDLFGRNKVKEELRKAFPRTIADPLEESPTGRDGASG